jgi:hypothetical protein
MPKEQEQAPALHEFVEFESLASATEWLLTTYLLQSAVVLRFGKPSGGESRDVKDLRTNVDKIVKSSEEQFKGVSGTSPVLVQAAATAYAAVDSWNEKDQLHRLAETLALRMMKGTDGL